LTPSVAHQRLLTRFGPQGWWPISGRYRRGRYKPPIPRHAFEICVGAVLTQNTAWTNVERALESLTLTQNLTPLALRSMPSRKLEQHIRPSGYFVQKAKKLKILARWAGIWTETIERLRKAPLTEMREELLELWGVGPETADSILLYAGGRNAFVVDTYTKRVGSRIGWFHSRASYDEVQAFFTSSLPASPKRYNEAHALFVRLAKEHCRTTPSCVKCPLRSGCKMGRAS